jgi:hypothetical protein
MVKYGLVFWLHMHKHKFMSNWHTFNDIGQLTRASYFMHRNGPHNHFAGQVSIFHLHMYSNLLEPHEKSAHAWTGVHLGPICSTVPLILSHFESVSWDASFRTPLRDMASYCTLVYAGQTKSMSLQHMLVCSLTTGLTRDLLVTGVGPAQVQYSIFFSLIRLFNFLLT